jgi:hypothetical protein
MDRINKCLNALKQSDLPWIKYHLEVEANGASERATEYKKMMLADERIASMLLACKAWPKLPLKRHNDANHMIHKIGLLLDLGLDNTDEGMRKIAQNILAHQSDDGAFLTLLNVSKNFGGSGEDEMQWIVCDFPILLYTLLKLGYEDNDSVIKAVFRLKAIAADNGWRCVGSVEKFRGPGKKADHCPYGTLVSLQAFSQLSKYHNEDFIKAGIDAIFDHWINAKLRKIYLFGIGTDFKKLKYPNVWFDIGHVLRVLSQFDYAKKSPAYHQMLSIVLDKQQADGGFVPESIYMAYRGWDFGQKKESSDMLTYQIYRILVDSR